MAPACNVVVLISGSGSNLQALIDSCAAGDSPARIRAVSEIVSAEEVKGAIQSVVRVTVEIEGSDKPACVVDTLALEQTARAREELNALYVALTRTRQTLVLSSVEPHREREGSWWKRLEALSSACTLPEPGAAAALPGEAVEQGAEPKEVLLKVLPSLGLQRNVPVAPANSARPAIHLVAKFSLKSL